MIKLYFQPPETPMFPQADLPRLISLSCVSDNPNWFYDMHKHDSHCELMFIKEGQGHYTLDNRPYIVKAGDIIALNKGVVHGEASDPAHPLTVWTCSVDNIQIQGLEENQLIPPEIVPVIPSGSLASWFDALFMNIYQERTQQHPGFEAMVQLYVTQMIAMVQRLIQQTPHYLVRSHGKSLSESIKQYIDLHYAENISLTRLSELFHVSAYHIAHEVKRDLGTSPINYLIGRRIGEAQRMLTSTDMTVSSISQAVGYGNISYFMKLFQRRVGVTPSRFRELYILGKTPEQTGRS